MSGLTMLINAKVLTEEDIKKTYEQLQLMSSFEVDLFKTVVDRQEKYDNLCKAVELFHSRAKWTLENGCGDSSCVFHVRRGQTTNGGCRCFDRRSATAIKALFELVESEQS